MRVLILHSRYRSGAVSGENVVVEDEARLLREAGHDVEVWAPLPDQLNGAAALRAGVGAIWSRQAQNTVRALIRSHAPDVVHVHNLFPMLSPTAIRSASEDAALVMTLHNYRLLCLPATLFRDGAVCEDCIARVPWPGVVHRCYRGSTLGSGALMTSLALHRAAGTFDRVRRFLAVSAFVRDKHVEGGVAPSQIVVKRNFAWPAPVREGPGDYFAYLGRLSAEKGVEGLLDAWADVRAPLVVAGWGPEGSRLRSAAKGDVRFIGPIAPREVPAFIARARAIMIPSTCYEASSRAMLEAYACGVPVIACRIGGLSEQVEDGVSGTLVEPGDIAGLAQAANSLFDDDLSIRLGAGALSAWHERFTPEAGLAALERCYEEAIGS